MAILHRSLLLPLALFALEAPAAAEWMEARTDHFVIDADTSEPRLRDFAGRLERFDSALRRLYGVSDSPDRHANPVIIFAVGDDMVSRLCRGCPPQVAGFYTPHAGQSVIVTSALGKIGIGELTPQAVLLHEYSHHFMYANATGAYPLWYSEGFAEFNGNAEFKPDGSVVIGLPAQYRAYGLTHDSATPTTGTVFGSGSGVLTITQLLDPPARVLRNPADYEQLYGRGWLLMHYLQLSPQRRGQLATYVSLFGHGTPSLAAASQAFGDLNKLGAELSQYLSGNRLLPPLLVPPSSTPPRIEVTALSPGAAAMMPIHMRSAVGTERAEAKAALPAISARAAAFPDDPRVQSELAEAAYDARDLAAAEAAADRALKVDPANAHALLYKGLAALASEIAKGRDPARLAAARAWLVKANRLQPDAAFPLVCYYWSFVDAGEPPSASAVNGMLRAVVLAPEDPDLRWPLARRFLAQNDAAAARELLQPIAFQPHGDARSEKARQVVERIDAKDVAAASKLMEEKTPTAGAEVPAK